MVVTVTRRRLAHVAQLGEGALRELDRTVRETLLDPHALFRGVRQDADRRGTADDGWLCYVSKSRRRYNLATAQLEDAAIDRVFLVFVNEDHVAYNWRWEPTDPVSPGLPENHSDRFKDQVR